MNTTGTMRVPRMHGDHGLARRAGTTASGTPRSCAGAGRSRGRAAARERRASGTRNPLTCESQLYED